MHYGTDGLVGRRELLVRISGATVGALLGVRLAGCGSSGTIPSKNAIHLERYGARGDGHTDDTAAIQRAVDAASGGFTILGERGKDYVLNGTISFPRDHVTFDLGGATIRTGPSRRGPAAASDTMFEVSRRQGVRITNGVIAAPLSRYTGTQLPGKILIDQSTGCAVSQLRADCDGSALITVAGGGSHSIERNHISRGGLNGLGCSGVLVKGNVIEDSPYDAVSFAGYRTSPANHNQYVDNVIRRCGRTGIEEQSPDGSAYNYGAMIRGNLIETPNTSSGTAISAVGTAALIEANQIRDPTGYAIETNGLGTRVLDNQISWRTAPSPSHGAPAIIINSSRPGAPRALVSGNHLVNATVAITVFANPYLGPLTVERNTIQNPTSIGIALAAVSGTFSGPTCSENQISFSVPAPSSAQPRIGIQTTTATQLVRNRISYGPDTSSGHTVDVPIALEGNDVVARQNVVVSASHTRGHLVSGSLGGTWSGWMLIGNQFLGGASANLSALIHPILSGNTGPVTL